VVTTWQSLAEVSTFVKQYAPDIIIKYSTRYMPGRAFVYPIGYRQMGLAVSGQLLDLWRKDQQAAKAILLHEIAHYRQGDAYIIGAGSLLEIVIRRWLLLFA
jgi:Zn-dependent protease with chaperone function